MDPATFSAATALVAVIVGPAVSMYVARRQIRASVVSTSRQKWIDSLRDDLAQVYTAIHVLGLQRSLDTISNEELHARMAELTLLESRITLRLNPNEEDHQTILSSIRESIQAMGAGSETAKRTAVQTQLVHLQKSAQVSLKREWQRVKNGD